MAETNDKTTARKTTTTRKPRAAAKSVQQKAQEAEEAPKVPVIPAKSVLPKVEGYQWTIEAGSLYLHRPANQFVGYNEQIERRDGETAQDALGRTACKMIADKQFQDELFALDQQVTKIDKLEV